MATTNSVVVRLRADIADFSSKLNEAQRMLATRIANIRASVREEAAIARQALREKEQMAEFGLKVDLDAARRAYHQRMELARATAAAEIKEARRSISERGAATAAGAAGMSSSLTVMARSTDGAVAGVGRLNGLLIMLAREATGVSPAVGRATDVLGTLAIGSARLVPILAGATAIAGAFAWITREARETEKAAEEAGKAIAEAWALQMTAGDQPLIDQQTDIGLRRDAVAARLREKAAAPDRTRGAAGRLKKLQDEEIELGRQYDQVTAMLTGRRTERQKKAAEDVANANKKAATDSAAAWKAAVSEIEEDTKRLRATWEGVAMPRMGGDPRSTGQIRFDDARGVNPTFPTTAEIMGAIFPPGFNQATNGSADAIERLRVQTDKLVKAFAGAVGATPTAGSGLFGPLKDRLFGAAGDDGKRSGGMLDPKAILNNALGGLASAGFSAVAGFAGTAVNTLAKNIFGLGDAGREAAAALRLAVNNIRSEIAQLRGDTKAAQFYTLQAGAIERLRSLGADTTGLERATSIEELVALIQQMLAENLNILSGTGFGGRERSEAAKQIDPLRLVLEWLAESMKELGETTNSLTDSMRNMPSGWKVNLAQFNATNPAMSPAFAAAARGPSVVHLVVEPEGVLRVVEGQAVRKIRSGGRLAWEITR